MDASFVSTNSVADDALLAGEMPRVQLPGTLLSGQNTVRGAVVGKITVGGVSGAAAAGNTGNGTIGTLSAGAGAKPGVYKVVIVEPAANAGAFVVEDPDGIIVGRGTVAVAFTGPVNFTVADGATDFVAGDTFDVTVAAGSGKFKLSAIAATDGSQRPIGILVETTNATAGDKTISVYRTGEFNEAALTFGTDHTASTVRAALEALQIYLRTVVPA